MVKCRDVLTEAFVGANKGSRQLEDVTAFNVETPCMVCNTRRSAEITRDNSSPFLLDYGALRTHAVVCKDFNMDW